MDDLAVCWATFRRRITSHTQYFPRESWSHVHVIVTKELEDGRAMNTSVLLAPETWPFWTSRCGYTPKTNMEPLSQVSSSSPRPPRSRPKVSIPQCSYTRKSLRAACVFVHHAWSAWSGMQLQPFYKANKKKDRCLYTYHLQEMDL